MAIDCKLTSDFCIEWSETGDITLVDGADQIEQAIIIQLIETLPLRAPPPVAGEIERQRADIASVVRDADVTEPPVTVTVVDSPLDEQSSDDNSSISVTYRVQTNRVSLPITTD